MVMERLWSQEELDYLKENYANKNIKEIVTKLNRSLDAIHHKASDLEIKKEGKIYIGEEAKNWKGGKFNKICYDGKLRYIMVYNPYHPYCDNKGYVSEHRMIVERFIKRFLLTSEVVHHIDGNERNNDINNLMIFNNQSEHRSFHIKIEQVGITNPIKRQIETRWDKFNLFSSAQNKAMGITR